MTGGNTYHHSIRTAYRGAGFYAALAFTADIIIIITLLSYYIGPPRSADIFSAADVPGTMDIVAEEESIPAVQAEVIPEPLLEGPDETANSPAVDETAEIVESPAEPSIEEKEAATPKRGDTGAPDMPLRLEDFVSLSVNRGSNRNYGVYGGSCAAEVLASEERPDGCLRLVYDVSSSSSSYSGYSSSLNGIDLSRYSALTFQLKKENGREPFAIELSDGRNAGRVAVNNILSEESFTGWQTVTIPLEFFNGVTEWQRMQGSISILFENSQGEPCTGAVYFRNIGFER